MVFPIWIEGIPSLGVFFSVMQQVYYELDQKRNTPLNKQTKALLEEEYNKVVVCGEGRVGLHVYDQREFLLFAEKASEEKIRTKEKDEVIKKGGRVYDYKAYLAFHRNQLIRPRLTKERSKCDADGSNTD